MSFLDNNRRHEDRRKPARHELVDLARSILGAERRIVALERRKYDLRAAMLAAEASFLDADCSEPYE